MYKRVGKLIFISIGAVLGLTALSMSSPIDSVSGADTWSASGVKSAQYQLSGAVTKPWTDLSVATVTSNSGVNLTIDKPGVTYLAVTSEDNAGNTSIEMEVVIVGEEQSYTSPIAKIEYKLSGASKKNWTTYSSPFNITNEGVTTIEVRVTDEAGNVGNLTREVKLDKTAPINNGISITLD